MQKEKKKERERRKKSTRQSNCALVVTRGETSRPSRVRQIPVDSQKSHAHLCFLSPIGLGPQKPLMDSDAILRRSKRGEENFQIKRLPQRGWSNPKWEETYLSFIIEVSPPCPHVTGGDAGALEQAKNYLSMYIHKTLFLLHTIAVDHMNKFWPWHKLMLTYPYTH